MMTTLLVDFEGYICSFVTNGSARLHDSTASFYFPSFAKILGTNYALGDPGYSGVPYVVSGFKISQLNNDDKKCFDRITRNEQVIVEHVNLFIKSCKCLSKRNQFVHGREKHVMCVFIVCGWYNWIKYTFGKFNKTF